MKRSPGYGVLIPFLALFVAAAAMIGGARVASPALAVAGAPRDGGTEEFVPGEIIVELAGPEAIRARRGLDSSLRVKGAQIGVASFDALGRRFGIQEMRSVLRAVEHYPDRGQRSPLAGFFLVRLGAGQDTLGALQEYRKERAVKSAQLNFIYTPDLAPNDPSYPQQYSHQVTDAEAGWNIETGDPSIVIAIIGEGTQLDHPDLAANIVPGYDFNSDDNDPSPGPGETHETWVSGSAAAVGNNALGVAGACWSCKIMPLRISYSTADVAAAIDYARENEARVINMSFGDYVITEYGPDTIVEIAVNSAFASGIVLVGTAGNNSIDTRRYPGAHENVIGVSATTSDDQRAGFSNFGSWVDVAAPGAGVLTTAVGGGYQSVNGTSFAAPYVAGLAGLILSKNPALPPATVKLMIEYSVDKITTDHFIGSGRVNVGNALNLDAAPTLFAVIKSPENDDLIIGTNTADIWGTALGDSYTLEYKLESAASWTQFGSGAQKINDTLGTFDVTTLPVGFYDIRLTARKGGSQDVSQISLFRSGDFQTGWPVSTQSAIVASPSYADLDGDGRPEILVANVAGRVHVYRHDGTPFPGWPQAALGQFVFSSPSVGDIDGDGDLEIVVGSYTSPYVSAWHHTGAAVSGFPRTASFAQGAKMRGAIPLVNLDADPALEMVVATDDGLVHLWNVNGSDLPGWPKSVDLNVQTTPAVGDVDGDGQLEIVVRQWEKIYVFNVDGSAVPGWPRTVTKAHTSPALGDLDDNGTIEVVDVEASWVAAYGGDGTLRFRTSLSGGFNYSNLSLGDVDGDGTLEIFVGANDGRVYGLSSQGSVLPGWPVNAGGEVSGAPMIADMDGDGIPEICVGSANKRLTTWNPDGTQAVQTYSVGSTIFGTPAAGDIDNDGDVELVAGNEDGEIHVLDFTAPWSPQAAEWPMVQADVRHTGHYRFDDAYGDLDGDGDPNISDCAPQNAAIHHGATEFCNFVDDDCDGAVDEGFDADGDGFTTCGGDCNDGTPDVHPGAPELCNQYDDNCNGVLDDGFDLDGDGYTSCNGDCNDSNANVRPGATETCNSVDDDCDQIVDEGPDADSDGWKSSVCGNVPGFDCMDDDPRINGIERAGGGWQDVSCWDRLDNDCDGTVDWDCALTVGDEHIQQGSRAPASGFDPMLPASADNTYVTYTEAAPGKKMVAFWTIYVPSGSTSTFYDLLMEAHRAPTNGNDTFSVSWARRNQSGECTDTSGETYTTAFSVTRASDPAGDPRLQAVQIGPPAIDTQAFCVKVVDSKTKQDSTPTDSLSLDRLYLMPVLLHVRATSEFTTTGSRLNGTTYVQTQSPDNVNEVLQESAAPGDALNHTWKFNVPAGFSHQLHLEGSRTNGDTNDNFQFYYATPSAQDPNQPGTFQQIPSAVIDVARGGINADFPFGPNHTLVGTVWIRVQDTLTPGSSQQRLLLDYMSIKTTP